MKLFPKITFLLLFSLMFFYKGYGQDSTRTPKVLYKITPEMAKKMVIDEKRFDNIPKGNKSVYSCEVDSVSNKAIISVIDEKGVITKETYILKKKK